MPEFRIVIEQLEDLRSSLIEQLRQGDAGSVLDQKLGLDAAISTLRFCEANGIYADSRVIKLPMTQTASPSSEYRVVEDHESDDRASWTELVVDGEPVRPAPETLLVEPPLA